MENFNSYDDIINNIGEKVNTRRSSLVGEKFNIISMMGEVKYEVYVKKLIGKGGSSLVYEVEVDDNYPPIKNMIMKEFYPNYNQEKITASRNQLNRLELYFDAVDLESEDRIRKDRDKFMDAYSKHIRILEMDKYLESKIVKPYRIEIDNSYLYALYEVDTATSVDKYYNLDLERIVDILKQTADILIHLHNNNVIYMDLKPANILYDYNNSRVKLFDFDAAIDLRELDYVNDFYMPNEKAFIPPELRYITDISNKKELFISEEIDLYMLGVTFFYLLLRRYPSELENEDMDFLARNVRDALNKKSNKILINKQASDWIIELLQESLSIHRYITVADFRNKLIDIENNLRFKNDETFSNIISVADFLDYKKLFDYIVEDDEGKHIDVAIVGDNELSSIFFSFIFAIGDVKDCDLNISLYSKNPKKQYKKIMEDIPLLAQSTKISINGKLRNKNINHDITSKSYANIDFSLASAKIDQSYIIILDETGFEYQELGDAIYDRLNNENQKRIILNYSRNNHNAKIIVDGNVEYYNLDLASTSNLMDRSFNDRLLDEAFEIHRFSILNNYGERVDNDRIWKSFLKKDFYNLKSSLRVALTTSYKLYMADLASSNDKAGDFFREVVENDDPNRFTIKDKLIDYEHHSWNRFMIAQGYKIPTDEQLRSYAYIDQKGYADFQNKFHPLITDSNMQLIKEGKPDKLAIESEKIKELVIKKTIHKEDQIYSRLINILNNTLWEDNKHLKEIKPLWEDLVNLYSKILDKEFYAYNSVNVLTYQIEKIIARPDFDLKVFMTEFNQIKDDINLIVRRDNEVNIRDFSFTLIDSLPLVISHRIKTIYKPFLADDENLWANIIAAIKFYPENLIFISDEPVDPNRIERISNFLINKRLQNSLKIEVINYEQMSLYSKENSVIDFTLNSHKDALRRELMGIEYVEYRGFNQWYGNYKALDYYRLGRSLTVEETFFLNNAKVIENTDVVNISRLIDYYWRVWEAYIKVDSDDWDLFIKAIRQKESIYKLNLDDYPKKKDHSLIEVGDFTFRSYDIKNYPSIKTLLDSLVEENLLIEYQFPRNPGRLKIHSYNDDMSRNIGDFISKHLWQYNHRFQLVRKEIEERNYSKSYTIVSDKLSFSYEYDIENPSLAAEKINSIMADFDKDAGNEYKRIFNHINDQAYVTALDNSIKLNFELGDTIFREFFTGGGNILKVYTYFELIKYADLFDEIKIDVNLRWKAYDDYSKESLPIENILDIVCTKGFSTFIISTIKDNIKNEDLYEINNHATQFGMDARPILIASNSHDDTSKIKKIAAAAGVYFIDRKMILENGLVDYIKNIATGKKDWKNIES